MFIENIQIASLPPQSKWRVLYVPFARLFFFFLCVFFFVSVCECVFLVVQEMPLIVLLTVTPYLFTRVNSVSRKQQKSFNTVQHLSFLCKYLTDEAR
ncbi:transmembrane protein, putative, partial [Bodo saltans]